jgi:hypothetical protein
MAASDEKGSSEARPDGATWSRIDHAAPQPRPATTSVLAPSPAGRATAAARLRRHHRPIVGALDAGGAALQGATREVVIGAALFLVPVVVLNLVASRLAFDHYTSLDGAVVSLPEFFGGIDAATGAETLAAYLAILSTSLAVAVCGGYLAVLVTRRSLGRPIGIRVCAGDTMRRVPALLVGWVVGHSWMWLGSLLVVQLSAGSLSVLVVLLLPIVGWIAALTVFVSPVIAVEHVGGLAGLRRSARLVRPRLATVLGFSLACVVIGGGMRMLITWLPRALESSGIITFGRFGWLAEAMAGQLSQLIVIPLVGAATAVLYLQIRMAAEGMDLVLEAERVFG